MAFTQDVLATPVQFLKGVGPKRAELLKGLGVQTLEDLLFYLPRTWDDRRATRDINRLTESGKVITKAVVETAELLPFRGRGLGLFKAKVTTPLGPLEAVWFKRMTPRFDVFRGLRDDVVPGREVWLIGRPENTLLRISELNIEEYYPNENGKAALHVDRIVPIHSLTEGLSGRFMRDAVSQALEKAVDSVPEVLPQSLIESRRLMPIAQALRQIHFPDSRPALEEARRRLAYQEFFLIGTALALKRLQTKRVEKRSTYQIKRTLLTPFRERLGYTFTRSQTHVINEIFQEMQGPSPMTRLLQGEVGSGKTVVAISALLLAVENAYQGAMMAPTEILAEQHFITISRLLKDLPVRVALLTSKIKKAQRARILAEIAAGEIDIIIGTHAILEDDVVIPNLSIAVIDEQHRFGVRQRALLRKKGLPPDMLVMTATPIPRTLALTLYGDLEISTLRELPPGRIPVHTAICSEEEAFKGLRSEVAKGHQAYVVYPVIEESARAEIKAATAEAERLRRDVFPDLRVELLHGQMPPGKKDEIMDAFSNGEIDILVATPVIEIGVDVPNATVMVVQSPERFGLASLHQLRGRVGRASLESWCWLVAEPHGPAAERLQTLCDTRDGFEISEKDLVLRGPGEVLGVEQHGPLQLRAGDLLRDLPLIRQAKEDSAALLEVDPRLEAPRHEALRSRLIDLFQLRWHWIDIS